MSLFDSWTDLGNIVKYTIIVLLLSGCEAQQTISQSRPTPPSIGNQDQLSPREQMPRDPDYYLSLLYPDGQEKPIEKLRYNALKETSLGFGSQTSYQERVKTITRKLELQSNNLSVIFDFGRVATYLEPRNGYLLPPVVTRAQNAIQTDAEGETLTSSDEYLTIIKPGRLYPVLPTWRDYLLIPASPINNPPTSLIPRDPDEGKLFDHYFAKGWKLGESQANDEFQIRIRILQQTYLGMLNYQEMVEQGIINKMVVVNADLGNLKDNQSLRINNRIVEIVSQASFEANPEKWRIPEKINLKPNLSIKTSPVFE